jgi:hypothetical protein
VRGPLSDVHGGSPVGAMRREVMGGRSKFRASWVRATVISYDTFNLSTFAVVIYVECNSYLKIFIIYFLNKAKLR